MEINNGIIVNVILLRIMIIIEQWLCLRIIPAVIVYTVPRNEIFFFNRIKKQA